MKSGLFAFLLILVLILFATAVVAQVFTDDLANRVWDEYIKRYTRIAEAHGVKAATARNQEMRDLIAQQNAFPSWMELTTQAVKDIGAERWNKISQEKMAELKAKIEETQAQ